MYNIRNLLNADLLIIDEIGFKKIPQNGLDDFFEIIRKRYENGSIIITTNRKFEDWGKVFGDQVLASAIIDRLVHHAHIIKITGESYRVE
jgi:DNA replication protein DnaC